LVELVVSGSGEQDTSDKPAASKPATLRMKPQFCSSAESILYANALCPQVDARFGTDSFTRRSSRINPHRRHQA